MIINNLDPYSHTVFLILINVALIISPDVFGLAGSAGVGGDAYPSSFTDAVSLMIGKIVGSFENASFTLFNLLNIVWYISTTLSFIVDICNVLDISDNIDIL
jgi:hypothetical protein